MTPGNALKLSIALLLALLAGCSSSSSSSKASVDTAQQDLGVDPDGMTTVLAFTKVVDGLVAANFEADGGQTAVTVVQNGDEYTITWDERVTPSHRVRVVGTGAVGAVWQDVTTTDASAPTFTITSATQVNDGDLGDDTITATFSGPRVVEASAEDLANWSLVVNGETLDLTGSTFDLDVGTQVLSVTLGTGANLHASFTLAATATLTSVADVSVDTNAVAGTATGDNTPPSIVSIEQNLAEDGFGRIVDVTFDEPMDPVSSPQMGNFAVEDHGGSTTVTSVNNVSQQSDTTIRLAFSDAVVPGLDRLILIGLMDAHGNAYPNGTEDITNSSPAVNAYDTVDAIQVENQGGDTIVVTTTQAFDPDLAVLDTSWTLMVGGNPITLADQTLTYSFLDRELTIALDFDMQNGDAVEITAVNLAEVDGEMFNALDNSATAEGDDTGPTVLTATQNRVIDSDGMTIDVTLTEDVDAVTAEVPGNWTFSGGQTVVSADVQPALNVVRLVTDAVVISSIDTVTASTLIEDLAGNVMEDNPQSPVNIGSTDSSAPSVNSVTPNADEGARNDMIVVVFDDAMYEDDLIDDSNWTVESPPGTTFDVTGATITYDAPSMTATVELTGADQNLKVDADVDVSFTMARDIAGNNIGAAPFTGTTTGDVNLPFVHAALRDPGSDTIEVRFTEPSDLLTDLFDAGINPTGTRFALRIGDGGANDGQLRGYPVVATVQDDGLGVTLQYGFLVDATDTVDVLGATDLAGNYLFPSMAMPLVDRDVDAPALDGSSSLAITSGEENDTIVVDFTEDMSPWNLLNPDNYTVELAGGGAPVDLTQATFTWDGTQMVTIDLDEVGADNLGEAQNYDVTVNVDAMNPLRTAHGVEIAAPEVDASVAASGDAIVPTVAADGARADVVDPASLVVVFSEAIDETAVEVAANFVLDGKAADSVTLVGPRAVRGAWEFPADVNVGGTLVITGESAEDLAGNFAPSPGGNITVAVTADSTPPLIASTIQGVITPNAGGDYVTIEFTEQVDLASALDSSNYVLTNGSVIDLSTATFSYDSSTATVRIDLPTGTEIDTASALSVDVSNVADVAGNAIIGSIMMTGSISGDSTAPSFSSGFVNWREDASGNVVDLLLSEDVDPGVVGNFANWTNTGTATVTAATVVGSRHVRLTLSEPIASSDELQITGVMDLAQNASGQITFNPQD